MAKLTDRKLDMPLRFALVLLAAALVISGCGGSKEEEPRLDANKAAGAISEGVKEQLDVDLRVTCPDDVLLAKEREFTCEGEGGDSETIKIKATQVDDEGNITWNAAVMGTSQIEESVAADIRKERDVIVTLDCPDAVKLAVDHAFECGAEDPDGNKDRIEVKITDEDGSVSWQVPDRPSEAEDAEEDTVGVSGEAEVGSASE